MLCILCVKKGYHCLHCAIRHIQKRLACVAALGYGHIAQCRTCNGIVCIVIADCLYGCAGVHRAVPAYIVGCSCPYIGQNAVGVHTHRLIFHICKGQRGFLKFQSAAAARLCLGDKAYCHIYTFGLGVHIHNPHILAVVYGNHKRVACVLAAPESRIAQHRPAKAIHPHRFKAVGAFAVGYGITCVRDNVGYALARVHIFAPVCIKGKWKLCLCQIQHRVLCTLKAALYPCNGFAKGNVFRHKVCRLFEGNGRKQRPLVGDKGDIPLFKIHILHSFVLCVPKGEYALCAAFAVEQNFCVFAVSNLFAERIAYNNAVGFLCRTYRNCVAFARFCCGKGGKSYTVILCKLYKKGHIPTACKSKQAAVTCPQHRHCFVIVYCAGIFSFVKAHSQLCSFFGQGGNLGNAAYPHACLLVVHKVKLLLYHNFFCH